MAAKTDSANTEKVELREVIAEDDLDLDEEDVFDELYQAHFNEGEDTERKMVQKFFRICQYGGVEKIIRMKAHIPAKTLEKWVNSRDDQNETPMHYAARNCDVPMIELLLELKARMDEKGQDNMTPLHYAARYGNVDKDVGQFAFREDAEEKLRRVNDMARSDKTWKAISFLLDHSKEVDAKDKYGFTVLHHAVCQGNTLAVHHLLKKLKDANEPDEQGNTALHLAAQGDHKQICHILVKVIGATSSLKRVNKEGMTPLHLAASAGSLSCIEELLGGEEGLQMLDLKDRWGRTPLLLSPLSCAAVSGDLESVNKSCARRAEINAADNNNLTALHHGAKEGHADIIQFLIEHGADVTKKDYKGRNPLEVAIEMGNQKAAKTIITSSEWKEAMRSCHTAVGRELDTPMRMLIRKYPDLAMTILDKCFKESNVENEGTVVDMNFEFIDDSYYYRDLGLQERKDEGVFHSILHALFWQGGKPAGYEHYTNSPTTEEDPVGYGVPYTRSSSLLVKNHPVMVMAEYARKELVRHPVCLTLVRNKWLREGRFWFYFFFLYYCLFLSCLTFYILTSPNPVNHPDLSCSAFFNSSTNQTDFPGEDFEDWNKVVRLWVLTLIGIFFTVRIIIEGSIPILFDALQHLNLTTFDLPWALIMDVTVHSMALACVIDRDYQPYTSDNSDDLRECRVWQLNALVLTLAWINLLVYMRHIPVFGKYITIFQDVLNTFLKVTFIIVIFLVAFALGFHVLLAYQEPFNRVEFSLLKVAMMMSGELDYDGIGLDSGDVPFRSATYILFVFFFASVSIMALNLLVGLSVNDIQSFLDEADVKDIQRKLTYALGLEKTYATCFRKIRLSSNSTAQNYSLKNDKEMTQSMEEFLSERRIWEQIASRSVESYKKTALEQLVEEQGSQRERLEQLVEEQRERLASMESVLLGIQDRLSTHL